MDPAPPPKTEVDDEEKAEWFSSLDPHMQRRIVVVGAVVLVVGLLGGFVAGFKVEQNLGETNDAKRSTSAREIANVGGVVTATATDSITIASPNGSRVKIKLPATVAVKKEVKGSLTDITVGSALLQSGTAVSKGNYDAAEIIVLPGDSKFKGSKVTAVNGDRVSVVQGNAIPLTVNVKSTTAVYTLDASSVTQIAKGAKVAANGSGEFGSATFDANEIIILVPGSAFAKR